MSAKQRGISNHAHRRQKGKRVCLCAVLVKVKACGSDVPEAFWVIEERRGRRKEPFAIRSLLGWTLMGPVGPGKGAQMNVHHVRYEDDLLSQQVAKFWETDFGDSVLSEKRGSPKKIAGQGELWKILSE
ncbi:hypothetical protein HOLleu_37487 [Holothuria leucospilota]|uniref:Uncharacterized protein n=1 Tax=Holothuria leucospilota TaxID=206669 RepID=A0A9Q0YHF3_HOLLE|nr:hypothetical protein HOLleu_37487 [Holothuria leucospilota]